MSLLNQESPDKGGQATPGEEYTKGSSHLIIASVVASVLVTIAIAIYVLAGEKPPASTGEIGQVWAHPRHLQTSGRDANGAPIPKEHYDQVIVIAHVKVRNQSDHPLFMHEILTNVTLADGVADHSYAAFPTDYDRVFIAYPELAALHSKGLSPETTIEPGQTQEGNIVSAFRMTKEQWDARKDLSFTLGFRYQPSLKLVPKTAVIEQ